MNKNVYKQKKDMFEKNYQIFKKKSASISINRLINFLLIVALIVLNIIFPVWWLLILLIIAMALFIVLIIYHHKIITKKNYFQNYCKICDDYLARFDDRWQMFKDGGSDFANRRNIYLQDLDIIGETSLFKYINICKSSGGREKLYNRLSNNPQSNMQLVEQQQIVEAIKDNIDFSLNFQTNLLEFGNNQSNNNDINILKDLSNNIESVNKKPLIINIFFSLATIALFIGGLFLPKLFAYAIIMFLINFTFSGIATNQYKHQFASISSSVLACNSLTKIYQNIANVDFKNQQLVNLREKIVASFEGIKKIGSIKSIDTIRTNFFILAFILNGILPFNFIILLLYQHQLKRYASSIEQSIDAFEDFEVNTSLAIIGQVKTNVCIPKQTEQIKINFKELYHPLLNENKCIPNDFETYSGTNIITGSNMSGKTSFMRTVGINMILMNAGTYVNATMFEAPYLKIFTSMRINDDISRGISTFYAELLRIKEAVEYYKTNQPMIAFFDEIFRGTNSNDRISGAIAVIKQLSNANVILFLTTHDFELCNIDDYRVRNFHFSEYYEGEVIKFDYKIKKGPCQTTNAQMLMRLVGIIK